jgi:hypothetical protein
LQERPLGELHVQGLLASFEEQHEVIDSLSSKYDTPEYTSPLGEPEVGYYCAGSPETTLEDFFENDSESGEAG